MQDHSVGSMSMAGYADVHITTAGIHLASLHTSLQIGLSLRQPQKLSPHLPKALLGGEVTEETGKRKATCELAISKGSNAK